MDAPNLVEATAAFDTDDCDDDGGDDDGDCDVNGDDDDRSTDLPPGPSLLLVLLLVLERVAAVTMLLLILLIVVFLEETEVASVLSFPRRAVGDFDNSRPKVQDPFIVEPLSLFKLPAPPPLPERTVVDDIMLPSTEVPRNAASRSQSRGAAATGRAPFPMRLEEGNASSSVDPEPNGASTGPRLAAIGDTDIVAVAADGNGFVCSCSPLPVVDVRLLLLLLLLLLLAIVMSALSATDTDEPPMSLPVVIALRSCDDDESLFRLTAPPRKSPLSYTSPATWPSSTIVAGALRALKLLGLLSADFTEGGVKFVNDNDGDGDDNNGDGGIGDDEDDDGIVEDFP